VSGNWQIQHSFGRLGNKAPREGSAWWTRRDLWQTWRERFPRFPGAASADLIVCAIQ